MVGMGNAFHAKFELRTGLGHQREGSKERRLIISEITLQITQPIRPRYINATDGRTDGQTTYGGNTVLCTTSIEW